MSILWFPLFEKSKKKINNSTILCISIGIIRVLNDAWNLSLYVCNSYTRAIFSFQNNFFFISLQYFIWLHFYITCFFFFLWFYEFSFQFSIHEISFFCFFFFIQFFIYHNITRLSLHSVFTKCMAIVSNSVIDRIWLSDAVVQHDEFGDVTETDF